MNGIMGCYLLASLNDRDALRLMVDWEREAEVPPPAMAENM